MLTQTAQVDSNQPQLESHESAAAPTKVIYDFGSNNGDDIPYYIKKADVVVAVEANPLLSRQIEARFSREIASGKLILENCVLTVDEQVRDVCFYIHKRNHV